MNILSRLDDDRILATNYLIEINLLEYLGLAELILSSNEYQRKRVKSSSNLYALLKEDFLRGCILPPIVLALSLKDQGGDLTYETLHKYADHLVILDGLQRTFTLLELWNEVSSSGDIDAIQKLKERRLRVEIYVGLNRLGVLYRMLTLNTGQTPMSLRQQIEMLYLDYSKVSLDGIRLVKEKEDESLTTIGEYTFKSMIEGFNSYIERNELPIDRQDLLESIKGLEKLSKEDASSNLFAEFVHTYHLFVLHFDSLVGHLELTSEQLQIKGEPFGKDVRRAFSKSQAITGFGAAIGKLKDFNKIHGFNDVRNSITQLSGSTSPDKDFASLLKYLEKIRLTSKKIGNSQRLFFHHYFRELFNPESDGYRNLTIAADEAYSRYETLMM